VVDTAITTGRGMGGLARLLQDGALDTGTG
jgi:hypothetical protein